MTRASVLAVLMLLLPVTARAQVVINEVLPDPAGTDTTVDAEWVELYFGGTGSQSLDGWSLEVTTTGTNYTTRYTFGPSDFIDDGSSVGRYLVVGETNAAVKDYDSGTLLLGNASSSCDAVRLLNNDTVPLVVDTVVYGPNNSDVLLDDNLATAACAPMPGSDESISRRTDGADTQDSSADFWVTPTPTPKAANPTPPACQTDPGTITINEFMPNPAGSEGAGLEWIELYNSDPTNAVDLDGWQFVYAGSGLTFSPKVTIDTGTSIAAGGFFVLGETAITTADQIFGANLSLGGGTGGDSLRLVDCMGTPVDTVAYGESANTNGVADDSDLAAPAGTLAPTPPDGQSIARKVDGVDTDDSSADFTLSDGSTMGAANPAAPVCVPSAGTITINEAMPNPAGSDTGFEWIELYNDDASVPVSIEGWEIHKASANDAAGVGYGMVAILGTGAEVPSQGFFVIGEDQVTAADHILTSPMSLGSGLRGDGIRLVDCQGTTVDTLVFGDPTNEDLVWDDGTGPATSIAPKPGDGDSIARIDDGWDTDLCGDDFFLSDGSTMGAANPEPPVCVADNGTVKLNELLVNPVGSDGEVLLEWVELYNVGTAIADLDGWRIQVRTSASGSWSSKATFPDNTQIAPTGLLLIGENNVTGADVLLDADSTMGLGSGTGADGVRLVDCTGAVADTVVYGDQANPDQIEDDSGVAATSIANAPGEGASLARKENGVDTDDSRADFTLSSDPSPGLPNPVFECTPSTGDITLNEALTDPAGTDSEAATEFIELYNASTGAVRIDGWYIVAAGQADDSEIDLIVPAQSAIAGEGFFVFGQENVEEADFVASFSLGNGTGGDGLYLYDCTDALVDAVVYGSNNDDGLRDETGAVAVPVNNPASDQTIARRDDGVDTNSPDDWFIDGSPTPGATNFQEIPDFDPDDGGGCNRQGNAPGEDAPSGCGAGSSPDGGCATVPLPFGGVELFLLPLVLLRRRR